jgi:hypothetical protein
MAGGGCTGGGEGDARASFASPPGTPRLLLFEGTRFTSFFKDKKSYRSHKTVGVKVFNKL